MFRWRVAAFDGLRFAMGEVRRIAVWALLVTVLVYGVVLAGYALGFPPDSYVLPWANTRFVSIGLVPVGVIATAVICCATYRAVQAPGEPAMANLRLGADEARMTGVFAVIVAGMAATSAAVVALGEWGWVASLVAFALFCRVSLVGPAVFRGGRFDLAGAWRLGGEWYWNLLLLNLLTAVLGLLGIGIATGVRYLAVVANYEALESGPPVELAAAILRLVFASAVVMFVYVATLVTVIVPGLIVHRELTGEPDTDPEPVADVFG